MKSCKIDDQAIGSGAGMDNQTGAIMTIRFLVPPLKIPPYCWLMKIGRSKVGVHQHDGWCMQLDDKLITFDSERQCMPLMPVLEVEVNKFSDFLMSVKISPDYSEGIHQFPKERLLKHVFHTSCSGYWPEKALAWLIDDKNLSPLFEDELVKFVNNSAMPQGARQKAKKILLALYR